VSSGAILLIGSSSVLGVAAARCISETGDGLILTYHREFKHHLLRCAFPNAELHQLDIRDEESVASFGRMLIQRKCVLDGIVYAAGVGLLRPMSLSTSSQTQELLDVNVHGALRVLRSCWPSLQKSHSASVVVVSSIMGLVGAPGMSTYGMAKAALTGLVRSLAIEWAPRGIRVNAIAPGIVPSPLVDAMFRHMSAEQVDIIRQRHPMGFGQPEDVGNAIEFLLSPKARWITGVTLPVDGGYTAQ
jgi:NAD(P)-dependent dehydrogenase (short-subunit alcohol dehydrogenase family)